MKLTVHSAYLYKTDSSEAKALDKKYDLWDFENASHLLWMNFTLENTGKKRIAMDYRDMLEKIYAMNAYGETMAYTVSDLPTRGKVNDNEILYHFELEPGEKITSNSPFLNMRGKKLEFIAIGVRTIAGDKFDFIAKKE